jgi:hypothetical protein
LAASTEISVGELAAELRQTDGLFFGFRAEDDFLGADAVGPGGADGQLK